MTGKCKSTIVCPDCLEHGKVKICGSQNHFRSHLDMHLVITDRPTTMKERTEIYQKWWKKYRNKIENYGDMDREDLTRDLEAIIKARRRRVN